MRKIILLIFFFTTLLSFNLSAQDDTIDGLGIFNRGNELYAQKNYEDAAVQYFTLLANGLESSEVYFNIGNCFYHQKNLGKAILNYERALQLAPDDEKILHNLQLANDKTTDEIEKIPTFFLARWWENIRKLASSTVWSVFAILLLWGGIAGFVMWIIGKERSQRKKGFMAGSIGIALSLVVFAFAYSSYNVQQNSNLAIVMSRETPLKALPDQISNEILMLHEGTKVKITEKITSWYKVRLENGEVGWISEKAIEEI